MSKPFPNVLLVAPIHDWPAYILECAEDLKNTGTVAPFPRWQAQASWFKALQTLCPAAEAFSYSYSWMLRQSNVRRLAYLDPRLLQHLLRFPSIRYGLNVLASKTWDSAYRQNDLLQRIENCRPEVVLISGGPGLEVLGESVWREAKRRFPSTAFVLLSGMPATLAAGAAVRAVLPLMDSVVTNDDAHAQTWAAAGARRTLTLPISAADEQLYSSVRATTAEMRSYKSDVCFIGTLHPIDIYRDRLELLQSIADLNFGIWTSDVAVLEKYPRLRACWRGTARGATLLKIYQSSSIGLNIHGTYMPNGANLRSFEIPGAGALQLMDHCLPGLFEPEKEASFFKSSNELRDKVQYYLTHPAERDRIAAAGRRRTFRDHTYQQRFTRLFSELEHA